MEKRYLLKRINDGRQWVSTNVKFVDWEDNVFGGLHDEISIGRSCMLNPEKGMYFDWLTTQIERIEQREDETHFFTRNSHYILKQLD